MSKPNPTRNIFVELFVKKPEKLTEEVRLNLNNLRKYFSDLLTKQLEEVKEITDWIILFAQVTTYSKAFTINVYANSKKEYDLIVSVITDTIPDEFEFHFMFIGDVATYIQSQ